MQKAQSRPLLKLVNICCYFRYRFNFGYGGARFQACRQSLNAQRCGSGQPVRHFHVQKARWSNIKSPVVAPSGDASGHVPTSNVIKAIAFTGAVSDMLHASLSSIICY